MSVKERTLAIIKPDSVKSGIIGKIISVIEESGLNIKAMKMVHLDASLAGRFYEVHRGKPFFEGLVEFMISGPVCVLALEGENAILRWREVMGATNPENALKGTIRKMFASSVQYNAVHGSDASQTAQQELSFFFSISELIAIDPEA